MLSNPEHLENDPRPDHPPAIPLQSTDVAVPLPSGRTLRLSRFTVLIIGFVSALLIQCAGVIGILSAPTFEARVIVVTSWMTGTGILLNQLIGMLRGEANSAHLRRIDHDTKQPIQAVMMSAELIAEKAEKLEHATNGNLEKRIKQIAEEVRESTRVQVLDDVLNNPAIIDKLADKLAVPLTENMRSMVRELCAELQPPR
jgi:signal transduction histidine kinase